MNIKDLLDFVKDNAINVADLAKAHKAEHLDKDDPWYKVIVRELRQKYEDTAMESDRDSLF